MANKHLTLFVTSQVDPSKIEEYKEACRPVWKACAAEPENIFFEVFEDASKPGRFRLVEVWNASREWFDSKQLTKPYYATMFAKIGPILQGQAEVEYFERAGEALSVKEEFLRGGS